MNWIKGLFFFAIGCLLSFFLNTKIGDIPPLGKFLNPFSGFWQNGNWRDSVSVKLSLKGLKEPVQVAYDQQGIPHIFAKNDHDLYFAQGYVTAKDRLWQMDFQTRYAAGRLAEVVGKKALPLDRYQRRMGMVFGAENMLEESLKDSVSQLIIQAYADGVNAYISNLKPSDYPLEFKLLDYKPEPWSPLNTALLLKLMSATLAGASDELFLSNTASKYGAALTENLFPNFPQWKDPIIPNETPWPFSPLSPPVPEQLEGNPIMALKPMSNNLFSNPAPVDENTLVLGRKEEGLGSNNWAVAPRKTKSGNPILANDPHLSLSLPSIWYQIQLHQGNSNSYGVSIPGAPCIIIGFNQQVAWGVTNVGSDVLDWYRITFKDKKKAFYRYNNQWLPLQKRIEKIAIRSESPIYDTVFYTHYGPISALGMPKSNEFKLNDFVPENAALKWIAHLPSNDLRTFYELNRAKDYSDYRRALTYYTAPAQNFVFADQAGDIAITSNGYFPVKKLGHGKYLLDGNNPADEWGPRIPPEQNPTVKNPARGFVSSANQAPTDTTYPYYLNWEFAPYDRGHRINQRLAEMTNITIDSIRRLQLDNHSVLADNVLDTLLSLLTQEFQSNKGVNLLKQWNHRYEGQSIAATIFDQWYTQIQDALWKQPLTDSINPMRYPLQDRTLSILLHEPESPWYGKKSPENPNPRAKLVTTAYQQAIQDLTDEYGPLGWSWTWGKAHQRRVQHLANIQGLGSSLFPIQGSSRTINAIREKSGPSWRMVVELGPHPKAYGILPGGASGNPGSRFYDNQLPDWIDGQLRELIYLDNLPESNHQIFKQVTLNP